MAKILVLHGPNLDKLGTREPEIYGHTTLDALNKQLALKATSLKHHLECFQNNHEGELIDKLNQVSKPDFLIFNPAAFTHTSIALRDAVLALNVPMVEVHLSNTFKREPFRKHSFFSDIAIAICAGFGVQGYMFALEFAHHQLTN